MSPKRYREVFDVYSDVDNCGGSALLLLLFGGLLVGNRLKQFGHAPLCNLRPERAFCIGSFVFPICARCTGMVAGVFVFFICRYVGISYSLPVFLLVVMVTPLSVDWFLQRFGILASTNTRRFITGLLFGLALAPQGITISL